MFKNYLGGENFENLSYYLSDCFSCILQQRKTMINTLPTPFVEHSEKFQICLFKIRFSLLYIFADFFFIIKTSKYSTLKHWNQFCGKRHHSYGIRCPVFTPSQLSIAGLITGHVLFLPWLFLDQWGKSETLIFNKCACL